MRSGPSPFEVSSTRLPESWRHSQGLHTHVDSHEGCAQSLAVVSSSHRSLSYHQTACYACSQLAVSLHMPSLWVMRLLTPYFIQHNALVAQVVIKEASARDTLRVLLQQPDGPDSFDFVFIGELRHQL